MLQTDKNTPKKPNLKIQFYAYKKIKNYITTKHKYKLPKKLETNPKIPQNPIKIRVPEVLID